MNDNTNNTNPFLGPSGDPERDAKVSEALKEAQAEAEKVFDRAEELLKEELKAKEEIPHSPGPGPITSVQGENFK